MILPTEESLAQRRRSYQRRGVVCAVAFVLMVLSALLPHIAVLAYDPGDGLIARSLFPAVKFFVAAVPTAEGFPAVANPADLGFGLVISYLGLAAQMVGLLIGGFTFWVLAAEDVGRWTRRFLLLAGLFLTVSAPTVVTGYLMISSTGVAVDLGVAWIASLTAGLIMVSGAIWARRRMDTSWYWTKPDLIT